MRPYLLLLPFILLPAAAMAQAADTPAHDTSQYTLFDPVPDDQLRSFQTDRPTKSNSPYTIDAGHFDYESDIVNTTYDHYSYGSATTSSTAVADTVLKLGLTNRTDVEVALAPFNFMRSTDRTTGAKFDGNGFGDVYTRVKFNVAGDDGGDYVAAIVPYFKAPTASRSLGNGHYEGGVYAPLNFPLPYDIQGVVMTEVDVLEDASLTGTHENYQNLVNFGHAIGPAEDGVNAYVEFYSDVDNDLGLQPYYTGDLAISWLVTPNFQLDAGTNIGLNKAAPDIQAYLGISQRF